MAKEHPFPHGSPTWPMASERAAAAVHEVVRRIEPGTKLFAVVRLATAMDPAAATPCVAVRGVVRRVEPQPDGQWGVSVQFTRHRFL